MDMVASKVFMKLAVTTRMVYTLSIRAYISMILLNICY